MGKLQQHLNAMTEGDALRNLIGACERLSARITPDTVAGYLEAVTKTEALVEQLHGAGRDVRAEMARLESIQDSASSRASVIVKAAGGSAAYAALRAKLGGDPQSPVWQLDARVAEARARAWRSLAILAAVVLLIGALGYFFRGTLFPPDPAGDAIRAAQRAYLEIGPQAAVKEIDIGLSKVPTDTQLLIWKGAWLQELGDPAADAVYAQARDRIGEREFLLERSMINIQRGQADQIVADTTILITANPNSAEAYFLRASGFQLKGDKASALQDLEKAAALAEVQDNPTLLATARVRIGELLQSGVGQ